MNITTICQNPSRALETYTFGEILKGIRHHSGLSGAEASGITGIGYYSYMNMESQKNIPLMDSLRLLSKAYGEIIWHICGYDTIKQARQKLDAMYEMQQQNCIQERRQGYGVRVLWGNTNIRTVSSRNIGY